MIVNGVLLSEFYLLLLIGVMKVLSDDFLVIVLKNLFWVMGDNCYNFKDLWYNRGIFSNGFVFYVDVVGCVVLISWLID